MARMMPYPLPETSVAFVAAHRKDHIDHLIYRIFVDTLYIIAALGATECHSRFRMKFCRSHILVGLFHKDIHLFHLSTMSCVKSLFLNS